MAGIRNHLAAARCTNFPMIHSLIGALLLAVTPVSKVDRLRTKVIFSETANLTYQLDVMSGMLPHVTSADFAALWTKEFLKSAEDRRFVKQWSDLEHRYDKSIPLDVPDMPMERPYSYVSLFERIRMAGLRSTSTDDFLNQVSLLVQPRDEIQYATVLRHFEQPFHEWWQREAAGQGRTFAGGLRRLMTEKRIQDRMEQFRKFYGPDLPANYEAPFSLIYRPGLAKAPTSGQQLDGISVVEFLPKEKPERRIDVILHEFCHFLYRSRTDAATEKFQQRFVDTGDSVARPAFNLLNEGFATALGNGIIGRQMRTQQEWDAFVSRPLSLYNDPYIDRAGKQLLVLVDDWLPKGKTLDSPEFASAYLSAMKHEFGAELTAPSLYLNEAYLYIDQRIGQEFSGELRRELHISGAYTSVSDRVTAETVGDFAQQPNLSAVFVIPPDQIDALVSTGVIDVADATTIRRAKKPALFGRRRGATAYTFVILAESASEAKPALKNLALAKSMFMGVYQP